jgi:hypothetical protein
MPLLKKISDDWTPKEFPDVHVGDTIQFDAPYEQLVRTGKAIIVDKDGNELELPGQLFECPVCFVKVEGLKNFTEHVSSHMPKPTVVKTEEKTDKVEKPKVSDDIIAKRLANLAKAREARKLNLENKK